MKKFASVLLAVLVVFSMFSFVVSAANPTLTVSASKTADIKAGDKVTVTVAVSKDSKLAALTVYLCYNADAFKVVSAKGNAGPIDEETQVPAFGMPTVNANYASGVVLYTTAHTYEIVEAGTLVTVELEALKATDSEITLEVDEAADGDYKNVEVSSNTVSLKGYVEPSTDEPSTDEPSTNDPSEHECEYSAFTTTKKATCKEAGVKEASCKICGDKITEAIPATGKCEPGAWKVTKKATTTAEGEKVQECKYCGKVLQRAKIAKLPSDPITNPAIPNTDAQA